MVKNLVKILFLSMFLWIQICKAEVRVAIIVPKTGEYKVWGDELVFGAQTAVDEINNNGGIMGEKLELSTIDDTCSDNLAVSTAQMLSVSSSIKPSLVIGPYCSNSFDEIAKIYSKAKIIQIVPTTLNYQNSSRTHRGVMKLVSFKEQLGKDFFAFYNQRYAGLKTALVYDKKIDGAKEIVTAIFDEFRKYGKVSLLKQFQYEDYDELEQLVSDVVSSDSYIIFLMGSAKKNGKLVREISELKANNIFFTDKYSATEAFFENAKKYLNTVYFMSLPSFENNPEFTEELVGLRLKGIEFDGLNIYGYAAVKMWADLVKDSNTLSYDSLSAKIMNKKVNNMWKNSFFNNTSVKNPLHYGFYQYQDGEFMPAR